MVQLLRTTKNVAEACLIRNIKSNIMTYDYRIVLPGTYYAS